MGSEMCIRDSIGTQGERTISIGTGAFADVIAIGNVEGATGVTVNSGTAGTAINSTGTGDITIDSDDTFLVDADGVLELNSSAGVIGIGNDPDAQDINIGTGAAARTITVGNTTGATAVNVTAGTGGTAIASTGTGNDAITLTASAGGILGRVADGKTLVLGDNLSLIHI